MNKKENGNEFQFSTIEEAIEDLRRGRLILCTDDQIGRASCRERV